MENLDLVCFNYVGTFSITVKIGESITLYKTLIFKVPLKIWS